MRFAPFVPEMVERAAKSLVIGEATYVFEGLIASSWQCWQWWHGTEFAVGSAVGSLILSRLSLRYVLTRRWPFIKRVAVRSPSLVPRADCVPAP